MADIFSLAPEGQAWTDNAAEGNAARPEDYDPRFYSGSLSALPRGVAEGTIGVAQTGVATSQKFISDPKYLQQFVPTYAVLRGLFPEADQQLNESYDAASKALTSARESVKPDAGTQGIAAQVLEGLGQFGPAMLATVAAGPVAGGAVAFGSTYEPTRQEFFTKGVDASTAGTLAGEQAAANALGMALPAGVGGGLAIRLLSGIGINTGFGAANRFAVSETLEDNGYSDLAKQYQVWDKQALLVDGVLGAAFGGLHHWTASRNTGPGTPSGESAPAEPQTERQNIPENVSDAAALSEGGPAVPPAGSSPEAAYRSRLEELQELSDQLMSRGDRQALAQEVRNFQHEYDQAAIELQQAKDAPVSGSGKALAAARAQRTTRINELDIRLGMLKEQINLRSATLAAHSRGGLYFDAKADLSRLKQGIIPESMRGLVREADIKPSDIDAAHSLNEGLHYDIESAPVLHGSLESVNAHVAAMDQATAQLMRGESVNVDQQIRGLDGVMKPDAIEQGQQQRGAMEEAFRENGVAYSPLREEPAQAPELRQGTAFAGAAEDGPGQVSTDPETGTVISSNSYDLMAARDMSRADPDLTILHPDTGETVPLSQALADMDQQIAAVQKESGVYSVAAACFLRNS